MRKLFRCTAVVVLSCFALLSMVPIMAEASDIATIQAEVQRQMGIVLSPKQVVGALLYFDKNLSSSKTQACASCHFPSVGSCDPDQSLPTSEGAVPGLFGSRNAPTTTYARFIPENLTQVPGPFPGVNFFQGGLFWDGRAVGLSGQAQKPFLNPVEMNLTQVELAEAVQDSFYGSLFEEVFGASIFLDINATHLAIADAVGEFEKLPAFSPFDSRYDQFLAGKTNALTAQEKEGLRLFSNVSFVPDPANAANCSFCHTVPAAGSGTPHLFTDFQYHNTGFPRNPAVLAITSDPDFIDGGLGRRLQAEKVLGQNDFPDGDIAFAVGQFRTPTLRNIAKTAPYGHNGVFKNLKEIVNFYNTRDVNPKWIALGPELGPADGGIGMVGAPFVGSIGLTSIQEDAIVAFLKSLTDKSQTTLLNLSATVQNLAIQP